MKNGAVNRDEISVLRSSITPCHKYYEKNIHGIFERIVLDNWIEYICYQNEISHSTLWSSFSACKNKFEQILFARLCEYRYNHAINQWENILKIQEYAKKKTDFIFGKKLDSRGTAIAKSGYFDLLFNVAANEMGYGELSASKVYSGLRTPNSPFVMSGVSREIMRNVLSGHDFEIESNSDENELPPQAPRQEYIADKSAMAAFTAIKNIIPEEPDSIINTIMKSIPHKQQRVYIPESFKAVIDLEIDALLESGGLIQKCGRCLEYFLKDEYYNHDYCSNAKNSRTCLSIMDEKTEAAKSSAVSDSAHPIDTGLLHSRCEQLYKEMAQRVNVDINQRDFSDWYKYLALIRENVTSGRASMDDFENFVEYSRTISFASKSKKQSASRREKTLERNKKSSDNFDREVQAFEFEKVERTPSYAQPTYFPPQPQPIYPVTPISPSSPTSMTRVIRGVVPQGVNVIGYDESPKPAVPLPDLPLPDAEPDLPLPDTEADLPLPDTAEEESEKSEPDEFVKIFHQSPDLWRPKLQTPAKTGKRGKPSKHDKYDKGSLLQNPYIREIINVNDKEDDTIIHEFPQQEEVAETPTLIEIPTEPEVPQLDFNSILSGIRRSDGFEKAEEPKQAQSDDGEPPVTHKTKRVMDAIFGKTKTINPYVKQGNDDD
jgi:hypothetical protein